MSNELCSRSTRKKRRKFTEIELVIKEANSLYIQNNLDMCIIKARDVLSKFPKCDRAYFLLGLVFEEKKDIIKAYNFYMIAAQLMKNNYELWHKLYSIATSLNLLSDKLYFIQILQRFKNSRELVVEKTELYKILKNKYKVLECKIEMFEFDGVDFEIFDIIRNQTKHRLRTSFLALYLIKYYKKNMKACGIEYLMNCVRLQYESGYLIGTKNTLEDYVFPNIEFIPNDIRIIYIVSCLANSKPQEETTLFRSTYKENELENGHEKVPIKDFVYDNLSEKIMSSSQSILKDLSSTYSKTLKLDAFLEESCKQTSKTDVFLKYSDLDLLITDNDFWTSFKEEEQIKPLVEVLIDLCMFQYAKDIIELLLKRGILQEFCNFKLGEIHFLTNDNNMAALYFEKVLNINPDNVAVKSKLYDIYLILGNKDMSSHFKTVNSLINYVDDTNNKDKEKYRFSFEDCQRFRDIYAETRRLFEIDYKSHIKLAKPLVDDFLKNEFIFISTSKFKCFSTVNDRKTESLLNLSNNINNQKNETVKKEIIKDNLRYLSLHGLDADEWFYLLIEFIISKVKNKNFSEVSFLIRRCLSAEIFVKRKDLLVVIFVLGIRHSIFGNDMYLLTFAFKKVISIFNNYNLSHYFFYLENFFLEPHSFRYFGRFLRNIRRYYFRSFLSGKIINLEDFANFSEEGSSEASVADSIPICRRPEPVVEYKIDPLCFLNTFINRSIITKTYKVLDEIKQPMSFNSEILKCLIYVLACKSRKNSEKNKIVRKGIDGLKSLLRRSEGEQRYVVLYNIGKVYDMIGFIGYAERFYKDAYETTNKELKKMIQFNLILIYKRSGNKVLQEKYYED
ncbi:hypothetical protein NGRA_0348 [Nosema granulosis]|uniref:Uncharacterized protein n=1 Tax=Nosema granulosis TaxID=83296 RepID=A0A9P6H1I6_9MICR|nr:hypothetical protein NGRA_0348 [Nosema granulosis]